MDFFAGIGFFWVGVVATIGFLIAIVSVATRSYWWATGFVILTLAFTHLTAFSLVDWTLTNWFTVLKYFSIYIVLGLIWATFAWFLHLNKLARQYDSNRAILLPRYLQVKGVNALTPDLHQDFREYMAAQSGSVLSTRNLTMSPSVMTGQVILWPFKLVAFFLGDAIKFIVDGFLSLFGGFFTRIQKWVFRKFPELN